MVGAATLFWLVAPQLAVDDVTTTLPYYFLSDPVSTSPPLIASLLCYCALANK